MQKRAVRCDKLTIDFVFCPGQGARSDAESERSSAGCAARELPDTAKDGDGARVEEPRRGKEPLVAKERGPRRSTQQ